MDGHDCGRYHLVMSFVEFGEIFLLNRLYSKQIETLLDLMERGAWRVVME